MSNAARQLRSDMEGNKEANVVGIFICRSLAEQ